MGLKEMMARVDFHHQLTENELRKTSEQIFDVLLAQPEMEGEAIDALKSLVVVAPTTESKAKLDKMLTAAKMAQGMKAMGYADEDIKNLAR